MILRLVFEPFVQALANPDSKSMRIGRENLESEVDERGSSAVSHILCSVDDCRLLLHLASC
jgi:hypothetical protein